MKQKILLLGALLTVCAFFLHVAAMRSSEEALRRAEALDDLLTQEDAAAPETFALCLGGEEEQRGERPAGGTDSRAGARMLRGEGRLRYVCRGEERTVVFEMKNER